MAPDWQMTTLFPGKHGFSSGGRADALQHPEQQAQQHLLGRVCAKPGEVALQVILVEAHVLWRGALAPNNGLRQQTHRMRAAEASESCQGSPSFSFHLQLSSSAHCVLQESGHIQWMWAVRPGPLT